MLVFIAVLASCPVTPDTSKLTANAGPDQTGIIIGATVTLDGSGSRSADGSRIKTYLWEQNGEPSVTLSATNTETVTFTAPNVTMFTTLEFTLTVTDNNDQTASATVTVRVSPPPPRAEAGESPSGIIELGTVTLNASGSSSAVDSITIMSYLWEQTDDGPNVTLSDTTVVNPRFTAPFVTSEGRSLMFTLTVTDSNGQTASDTVAVTVSPSPNADVDGDGLIEIDTLVMLNNMRHNLAGTSYKTSTAATGVTSGCPSDTCTGYELTHNLDFDVNGDGMTWSGDNTNGFTLNMADTNATYFNVSTGGWLPIGGGATPFTAIFDGNGNTISNLAIQRTALDLGFFGRIDTGAVIRNIGFINNLADYNGDSEFSSNIGGLVGWQEDGNIIASYTTGLAIGSINSTTREGDYAGGLVGRIDAGVIIASYATGTNSSYGTVSAVGGLVGLQTGGDIIASYATGNSNARGSGAGDRSGGLLGWQNAGNVVASYATGTANAGTAVNDRAGSLIGDQDSGTATASYGFGTATGTSVNSLGTPPMGVTGGATGLRPTNAGSEWNDAAKDTEGAWDFTAGQAPAVKYADYDGSGGSVYSCDIFPAGLCDTIIPGQR